MRGTWRIILAATVIATVAANAPLVQAAEPTPFASASGTCTSENTWWSTAPVPSNHPSVVGRYTASSAPVAWYSYGLIATGDDVLWAPAGRVNAGESEGGNIACGEGSSVPFSADFYDTPATPTAFSGMNSFGSSASEIAFAAPGEAQYVAQLALGGGAVELATTGRNQTFASSGDFALGTIERGESTVRISALEGPQAVWSLQISALPVALSGVAFERPAVEPGKIIRLDYTTSGETSVTATIQNAAGQTVRTLATGFTVRRGDHTLTWDGRDPQGDVLPDGAYTAHLTTLDPSGATQVAEAPIQLDSGPQTFWTRRPPRVSHHTEAKFAFRASEPGASFQCLYAAGWRGCRSPKVFRLPPGHYRFAVRAVDRYGIKDHSPAVWRFRIKRKRH